MKPITAKEIPTADNEVHCAGKLDGVTPKFEGFVAGQVAVNIRDIPASEIIRQETAKYIYIILHRIDTPRFFYFYFYYHITGAVEKDRAIDTITIDRNHNNYRETHNYQHKS